MTINIKLTKQEYETLIKCFALGNFVLGLVSDFNEFYKYDAQEAGKLLSKLLDEAPSKKYYFVDRNWNKILSEKYFEEVMEILDEYEEYSFWENLVSKLSGKFIPPEVLAKDEEEILKWKFKIMDLLYEEFEKNWLENVKLDVELELWEK